MFLSRWICLCISGSMKAFNVCVCVAKIYLSEREREIGTHKLGERQKERERKREKSNIPAVHGV